MSQHYDVVVIGGGIVGLSHAWAASKRNLKVLMLERTSVAEGASVRNFGMVWPVGQPAGKHHDVAMLSRELWLELDAAGVLEAEQCGSVHLAHHQDELAVLEEFCELGTHPLKMMSSDEVTKATDLANRNGLLGGMHSPTELRVDPRIATARIASWLNTKETVECRFNTPVTAIEENMVLSPSGEKWTAERIIICSGSDLQTLYPKTFGDSGLKLCKLQMLRSVSQPSYRKNPLHLASGLTLRHYDSFLSCPSLQKVKQRVATENPKLDQFGIHVMASQFSSGEVVLGDSHEYDDDISPFDKIEIDELILSELKKVIHLEDWTIKERWHGIYAKHPELVIFEKNVENNTHVFVGPGGAGMTLSLGLAERVWKQW